MKIKEKKHNITYIAMIFDTGQLYIGVRSCNDMRGFYEYETSSSDLEFKNSLKMKHIIADFPTRKEAMEYEILLHGYFDVCRSDGFANLANSTTNLFDTTGIGEVRKKEKEDRERAIRERNKAIEEERLKWESENKDIVEKRKRIEARRQARKEARKQDKQPVSTTKPLYVWINTGGQLVKTALSSSDFVGCLPLTYRLS